MANNPKDQPGRVQPNESENQPGSEPEKTASQQGGQRSRQDDQSQRRGFDDRRKDEMSNPPPGGIDPNAGESGEEQGERKNAGTRDDDQTGPRKA